MLYRENEPLVGQFPNRSHLIFSKRADDIFVGKLVCCSIGSRRLITEEQYAVWHRSYFL